MSAVRRPAADCERPGAWLYPVGGCGYDTRMPYMLLVVEQPNERKDAGREEGERRYDRMLEFAADLQKRGLLIRTESLSSQAEGVRIQKRNGKATVMDGPFAEAKEVLGGFFLLDCETFEEAVAIGRECPAAEWSTIEVRGLGPCFVEAQ